MNDTGAHPNSRSTRGAELIAWSLIVLTPIAFVIAFAFSVVVGHH